MKIIVNERQYILIKEFIDEAKGNSKYSPEIMTKLGKDILTVFDEIGQGKTTEFQLASGNKVILKCVSDDNYVFKFEILEDTSKALKNWDTLVIKINPGNGDIDGTQKEYLLNSSVIEPAQNGFTLLFQASKKTGPKGKVKLNGVTKVSPSSVTKPIQEPEQEEPKQEEPKQEEQEITKADAEAAYEKILNNPELRDAFYKQPSFWQMFKAELKGQKAAGSGIIRALDILDKYDLKIYDKVISNKFVPNEIVTLQFKSDITIVKDKTNKIFFKNGDIKRFMVGRQKENEKIILRYYDDKTYYIRVEKRLENKDDEFGDVFNTKIGGFYYEFKILTDGNKSPGYNPEGTKD